MAFLGTKASTAAGQTASSLIIAVGHLQTDRYFITVVESLPSQTLVIASKFIFQTK